MLFSFYNNWKVQWLHIFLKVSDLVPYKIKMSSVSFCYQQAICISVSCGLLASIQVDSAVLFRFCAVSNHFLLCHSLLWFSQIKETNFYKCIQACCCTESRQTQISNPIAHFKIIKLLLLLLCLKPQQRKYLYVYNHLMPKHLKAEGKSCIP